MKYFKIKSILNTNNYTLKLLICLFSAFAICTSCSNDIDIELITEEFQNKNLSKENNIIQKKEHFIFEITTDKSDKKEVITIQIAFENKENIFTTNEKYVLNLVQETETEKTFRSNHIFTTSDEISGKKVNTKISFLDKKGNIIAKQLNLSVIIDNEDTLMANGIKRAFRIGKAEVWSDVKDKKTITCSVKGCKYYK